MMTTFELQKTVKRKIEKGDSWGEITRELYPNGDTKKLRPILWRIVNDNYIPVNNHLRAELGLVLLKKIEACPICNEIHLDRCPKVNPLELPHPVGYKVIKVRKQSPRAHIWKREYEREHDKYMKLWEMYENRVMEMEY
jgi:hypothetical protein